MQTKDSTSLQVSSGSYVSHVEHSVNSSGRFRLVDFTSVFSTVQSTAPVEHEMKGSESLFRSRRFTRFSESEDLVLERKLEYIRNFILSIKELKSLFVLILFPKAYSFNWSEVNSRNELKDVEILKANCQPLMWLAYGRMENPRCCEKYLKNNNHNSLHLKICSDFCPWTLSVPRS